jgi:GTP-binding protein YchF
VVRCFRDADVPHVEGSSDPVRDLDIINTELMLADLEVLDRAGRKLAPRAKSGDDEAGANLEMIEEMKACLNGGTLLSRGGLSAPLSETILGYGLITMKPVLYLANVDEDDPDESLHEPVRRYAEEQGAAFMILSAKVEEEISELPEAEKKDFLNAMNLQESGLARLVALVYDLLHLITFYTITTDLQAWTVRRGTDALDAAGRIHSDFQRGFIRAEVFQFSDLLQAGSEHGVREHGVLRTEGRDYVVQDGDIIHFLFNV